ncbi:MAG: pyruvate:ferredoxin (flavodoxin) oxidoreductase [Clostridiales bacterium]|nr:pyruvate:ferredoxin (flavodoxin) oxidoreductase [Clostridiales bacterium]
MAKRRTMTMDGNTAAAWASYAFTEVAAIYPITPSSPMAEHVDEWSAQGKKNIFGQTVLVKEMEHEGGAAGAVHGSLQGGAITTTYTASQGLLLMIPNMYKIAGELLPGVFHVSARSLASNSLSIFGDHQDVMACRQTGFALLASSNVQQAMDLGTVAHLAAIKSHIPFLHFFDGFRTSHEMQKIEVIETDEVAKIVDWDEIKAFRDSALNPDHPVLRGTTVNPDIFFQLREATNKFYLPVPEIVEHYMNEINKLTGRNYKPFNYYGSETAEEIIVAMGSGCDALRETITYINEKENANIGLLEVHLYRPFSAEHFLSVMPKTVKKICVLDRTKEPGAIDEPLCLDVKSMFFQKENAPEIIGGRYGLASKDFTPNDIMAVVANLKSENPKDHFCVGVNDDVTFTSLPPYTKDFDPSPAGATQCQFWGLGSDGTVSANKSAIKIIGDHTDMYAQAYFAYDSKKSGGLTVSHLRFGTNPIQATYNVKKADFIACHNQSYVHQYDLLDALKDGGVFLLNCIWTPEQLEEELPNSLKIAIAKKHAKFYTLNAVDIAKEIGLGGRINMIMQSAFFKLANILPIEDAVKYLKDSVQKSYGKKGQNVVDMNNAAIDKGISAIVSVDYPASWADLTPEAPASIEGAPEFVNKIMIPMNRQKGDDLPVSAFAGMEDGTFPTGVTAYEKRGIAIDVPVWNADKCIQCNICSYVCPHAVIRPILLTEEEAAKAPEGYVTKPATGKPGLKYHMAISAMDCTGCGLCVNNCPTHNKPNAEDWALSMKAMADVKDKLIKEWDFNVTVPYKEITEKEKATVKGSQFLQPLLEFNGACAGCGETAYAKLVTQLFGDRMMISNSAGCSTVWPGAAPSIAYSKNARGFGPAWDFSLFEDNGEFGLGMLLGTKIEREGILAKAKAAAETATGATKEALDEFIADFYKGEGTRDRADKLVSALEADVNANPLYKELLERKDFFAKRSHWIFGGDGWAYDIGYGGLDHVLASGENINVLVFDTEVYSNTGGQSSKATPTAAIAQFAASGKDTCKKDLGMMAASYGYVYVAQIALGADRQQTLNAIREAEAYEGPSLIIAYSPCINHGIKAGMGKSLQEVKKAVDCGYWSMYRFNPDLKKEGKNPFILDSTPEPNFDALPDFMMGEVRYASLKKAFPEKADALFAKAVKDAKARLDVYKRMARD